MDYYNLVFFLFFVVNNCLVKTIGIPGRNTKWLTVSHYNHNHIVFLILRICYNIALKVINNLNTIEKFLKTINLDLDFIRKNNLFVLYIF